MIAKTETSRKAFKYRLYPNKKQQNKLAIQFGHARFVYNYFLSEHMKQHKGTGKEISYHVTASMLTELKQKAEFKWLKEADSQVLQQSLRNLQNAYDRFFKKQNGFPKFKSLKSKQSIRYPQRFKFEGNRIYLPKVGWVKAVFHRQLEGTPKSVTVSKTKTGKYFISFLCEVEKPNPEYAGFEARISVGLQHFAVTSAGEFFAIPKHLLKTEKRLRRLQRSSARKQIGSAGQKRMLQQIALLHEKVANQRKDFHHKLSKYLVDKHGTIYLEDLHVKGVAKNTHLAKHSADAGWSEFTRQLAYKGEWYGCWIEKIGQFFPSSNICSVCGQVNEDPALNDRNKVCPGCGAKLEHDPNAAIHS